MQTIEQNLTTIVVVLLALVCIIWIVTIFLSTIGKVGLIRGTAQVEGGTGALAFGELFSGSLPYFWRMFGLSIILGLPALIFIVVVIAIVIVGMAAAGNNAETAVLSFLGMFPLIIAGFCVLVPIMFVLGMIFRQSENAVVLEGMRLIAALARGWEVFRKNLGPIILMAIILGVIGFVVGLVVAIPIFIIVFPAMLAFMATGAESITPLIFMGACLLLYVPVAWVLQGIITAYTESAWTLTYMRLTNPQSNAPMVTEANA